MSSYPDSVQYLYSLANELKVTKFDLENIRRVVAALDNPHNRFRSVHVAGTNGKGSTCAMIESALRQAGYRTGLYTSPHLVEPTERICINGSPVSRDEFVWAFQRVYQVVEKLLADQQIPQPLTYFEMLTAMAFCLFEAKKIDYAVVEVGMGGRLDATNVISPELTVITPVDYDHERYLGSSLESIAREKAGILKPGIPVVLAPQHREAEKVILERASELNCQVIRVDRLRLAAAEVYPYLNVVELEAPLSLRLMCPLAGRHQLTNLLTAVCALYQLGVPAAAIEQGIRNAQWPGRFQLVGRNPDVVLDGAHNPAGARALAQHLRECFAGKRLIVVLGVMRDKSIEELIDPLVDVAHELILTAPQQPRAVKPESLLEFVTGKPATIASSVQQALDIALRRASSDDVILVTGSLYLVGEAYALLKKSYALQLAQS